ncbi:MAG: LamG domain-containing protein [Alphaproteobacteria bacterium]
MFEIAEGSIQLWFKTRDADDRQTLFAKDQDGRSNGLRIYLDDNDLKVRLEDGGSVYRIDTNGTSHNNLVRSNTWYQLTFTFGAGGMRLYVNGVLVGSNAYTGGLVGNREAIVIGGSNDDNTNHSGDLSRLRISDPFDGMIDEVAVYGVALTPAQIAQTRERGPLGVIGAQDQGDTLLGIERLELRDAPLVLTAATEAIAEVEITSQSSGGWSERWPDLESLVASYEVHGLGELIVTLKEEGFKLFGHTSAEAALFSIEGIALGKDGRTTLCDTGEPVRLVDDWIRESKNQDHVQDQAKENKQLQIKATKDAKARAASKKTIDWNASFHGLGAALSSGKAHGSRGAAQANFVAFDKQPAKHKKKSSR